MNKYFHAVGFCVGLVCVIVLSAINGALLSASEWTSEIRFPLGKIAYSLLWLASYILTAATIGEFIVGKQTRKMIFLPLLLAGFTLLFFLFFYKLRSFPCSVASLSACLLTQGCMIFYLLKSTRVLSVGAILNFGWYFYLLGINVIIWIVDTL